MKEYFGVTPVLSNISCWISQPQENQSPKDSQYYHRDKDGLKWLELFVYLTEVCLDSGPHCYISGSHKGNDFLKKLRLSDHEVFNKYDPKDEKVHIGSMGDAFIEDTFGIHKGMVPKLKKRIVLQFQYSMYPLIEIDYSEKKQPLNGKYSSYVNQYFYK